MPDDETTAADLDPNEPVDATAADLDPETPIVDNPEYDHATEGRIEADHPETSEEQGEQQWAPERDPDADEQWNPSTAEAAATEPFDGTDEDKPS